jgi:hypothetical protein
VPEGGVDANVTELQQLVAIAGQLIGTLVLQVITTMFVGHVRPRQLLVVLLVQHTPSRKNAEGRLRKWS